MFSGPRMISNGESAGIRGGVEETAGRFHGRRTALEEAEEPVLSRAWRCDEITMPAIRPRSARLCQRP